MALLGLLLILGSLPGLGLVDWGESHVGEGVTLMATALGALVALRASVTWAEQRQRDVEASERAHRESVYEELLGHMVSSFTAPDLSPDQLVARLQREAELRAKVALWGSPQIVHSIEWWFRLGVEIMSTTGGVVTDEYRIKLWESLEDVLTAARVDVAPEAAVNAKDAIAMVFNDHPPSAHSAAKIEGMKGRD